MTIIVTELESNNDGTPYGVVSARKNGTTGGGGGRGTTIVGGGGHGGGHGGGGSSKVSKKTIGIVVGALALVGVGGGLIYSRFSKSSPKSSQVVAVQSSPNSGPGSSR